MRPEDAIIAGSNTVRVLWDAVDQTHGIIQFDAAGTVLEVNATMLGWLGCSAEDIVGKHFDSLQSAHTGIHTADRIWPSIVAGERSFHRQQLAARNGGLLWLQSSYSPVLTADGTISRIVQIATDVSQDAQRELRAQSQLSAIRSSHALITFDVHGIILDANDIFLRTMGYTLADIVGRHHRTFVEPSYAHSAEYALFWRELANGQHQAGQYRRFAKTGDEIWLQAIYNPVVDRHGATIEIVKIATPITDEKRRQADLQGQISAIGKSQGLISFDLHGTILEANENFAAAVGYHPDELRGQNHRLLTAPEDADSPRYAEFWNTLRTGNYVSGLYRRIGKNGKPVWIQASYNPILDLNGKPSRIVKFATDVTSNIELAEAYEDAKRQSQHDPVTALPNRVRLLSFIGTILAQPDRHLALLYLDLDRFKPINDSFGHHAGDRVLCTVADRLRRTLTSNQLAARIGGDEFIVAAPDLDEAGIGHLCHRIIDAIASPIRLAESEVCVGVSIGISTTADARSPDELLRCADDAMYRAKQGGRGTFYLYSSIPGDGITAIRSLADEMRQGLARGEFTLDYQPRFDSASGRIVRVEALIRWNHPTRGLIAPMEFIPTAERSGLIVHLGEWVLREACRAATGWPGIGLSVNVSPLQVQSSTLIETVASVLAETGLPPANLELEITERTILAETPGTAETLAALKRLGVRIAMDDFGSGFSSLASLRAFPFDAIKIDRRFIHDIDTRDTGRPVIQAILALAAALDLTVTAEGVETLTQRAILTDDRCPELQGFLLARPMPADRITALLQAPRSG